MRVFAVFEVLLEYVLQRMRVPSSRQQLKFHLQVAAFLSRAVPGDRDDERSHVLQPLVVEEPHMLQPVRLLDEPLISLPETRPAQ